MVTKLASILLSVLVALALLTHPTFHELILSLGSLGYLGGFIAGMFFIFTFTVAPAAAVILVLSDVLNPLLFALVAGLGAMCGDYIIYRFFRKEVDSFAKVNMLKDNHTIKKLRNIPAVRWLFIVVGALIIASPFPDELGVALLGVTQFETKKFLILSFVLNTIGILVIIGIGRTI